MLLNKIVQVGEDAQALDHDRSRKEVGTNDTGNNWDPPLFICIVFVRQQKSINGKISLIQDCKDKKRKKY